MRLAGMNGIRRTRKVPTTIPDPAATRPPDLLARDFTAPAPGRVWVADFTYVRTWAGFVYVAFIIDAYSRRIVAWNAAGTKTTPLVVIALHMALWGQARA